jgi:ACS family hexuronate transporter-like MFS transporter
MMLLSLLSYVDRNVLAILSHTILREEGLSAEQFGWIISAFSVAYCVGNPLWGHVLDRFGVRVGLALAVALWTLASASHALAGTLVSFAIARAALGFGEGATFPGGLRTATQTLRPDQRSRGVALAYSGGSLGAVLTPLVMTPIALRWGWRGAFVCTGIFGCLWLVLWSVVSRDPRLRPQSQTRAENRPRLTDPSLWGFMAVYAFGGLPLGFVLYGAPIYLGRRLGCDQATLGHLLFIPPLGWEAGYFFWGWVMDRSARGKGRVFGRLLGLLAVLSFPLAATPFFHSRAAVLTMLFFAMFVAAGFVIVSLAETTQRHSVAHGAYLAGLGAGSWSGVVAVAMPIFGRLFDRDEYRTAYVVAACAPAVGWLLWLAATFLTRWLPLGDDRVRRS